MKVYSVEFSNPYKFGDKVLAIFSTWERAYTFIYCYVDKHKSWAIGDFKVIEYDVDQDIDTLVKTIEI